MLMASMSSSSWLPARTQFHHQIKPFSALAQESDYDDEQPLLPTKHSRKLPPPVCPPSLLRSEVEAIFDAPVGTLIAYSKSQTGELKSAEEEMTDAYYAADNIVQRVEFILRGLNSVVSNESYVSRSLKTGAMSLEEGGGDKGGADGDVMTKQDCFRAMIDLLSRIQEEGDAYDDLRRRVRSQLTTSTTNSDDSSSSSSSDSDSDDEEGVSEKDEEVFNEWSDGLNERMEKVGFKVRSNSDSFSTSVNGASDEEEEISQEDYQFGASPGLTVHMVDLVLDALACLCGEEYGTNSSTSDVDLVQLMGKDASPPPAMGKDLLDTVLHRHWLDGGDIGLNADGKVTAVGQGIGIGSGTGAGSLSNRSQNTNFDVRTCPTPMTFNAVIRIASNFDPKAHAEAVEKYNILNGEDGSTQRGSKGADKDHLKQQQEMLRDITIDAAFSTYSRMKFCSALTIRALKDSTKNATSRSAVKRQAKLVSEGVLTGRNSATYAYLLRTVSNCIPPSLSRGNIAFGLYHKACVQEGVMDENMIKAMRGIGGYEEDSSDDGTSAPPVSNGPIFDKFLQADLGAGVSSALGKGRSQDKTETTSFAAMLIGMAVTDEANDIGGIVVATE
eukprot:CAMPEP_0201714004 /NCGR_PEP_ID=MMETSP0593-20130828/642_1 /ASSEMBLY_ACC=CAM_ASM_000672 /TAXON_ID=267983 /ORGANISM="Skeletonema japonicum, Strain CCMP2506" /LENGTH=612 /DNA_ID=CAMNT_0048203225 /DNA_START=78 /DNA_END=1917 /DNA_ORIENTATION=-